MLVKSLFAHIADVRDFLAHLERSATARSPTTDLRLDSYPVNRATFPEFVHLIRNLAGRKGIVATTAPTEINSSLARWLHIEPGRLILIGLLVLEIVVFSVAGTNFFSLSNAFEVLRLSVEIGLLAVALTPVITTGGIDLSVGSLLGLSAVVFGKLWRDGGFSIGLAAITTLALGVFAGSINGLLITRGRIPPLIVTLGTFSLFRGLAEGLTGGVDNFTHFPNRFLFLGQGYALWDVPGQLPIFMIIVAAFWIPAGSDHDWPWFGRDRVFTRGPSLCGTAG